ncbi:hypothetical protein ACFQO1_06195 [Jejudonia soesokkakensis]|uniref:Uncharacterized protein n=1 Tax=Jejudonia soesokkakensis TaxID=1323432 RepID=A0ABW2MQW4_9FLAO
MKIGITLLIGCLAPLCLAQADFDTENEVYATINFNGRHCRGDRGICSVIVENKASNANSIIAVVNDSKIELLILKDALETSEFSKICGIEAEEISDKKALYFIMEEPFMLPENLISTLHLNPQKRTIQNKEYAISVSEEYFIITLNLQ